MRGAAVPNPLLALDSSSLKGQLAKLGLFSMASQFETEAERAAKSESSYTAYLARLVEAELADKTDRSVNARIARARFPWLRTFAIRNALSPCEYRRDGQPHARLVRCALFAHS